MSWKKLGLAYSPQGSTPWQKTHAYTPTPILLDYETIRVFVSFLDESSVGRLGYVDVSAKCPTNVIKVSQHPIMDNGEPGCFDDNGVTPVTILKSGGKYFLYYTGWQLSTQVRYLLFTGLATSSDNGNSFHRVKSIPILDRSEQERTVRTAANVLQENGIWKMWYIAGSSTIMHEGKQMPTYSMYYLESLDGIVWPPSGKLIMEPQGNDEFGFGRPYICKTLNNTYEMWYSIRSKSREYQLGYATSFDGISWIRRDTKAGLKTSKSGWDSEMIAFASICDTKYGRYMFYNGNNYGREGFGVAKWQED